jgi:hypothetical protein
VHRLKTAGYVSALHGSARITWAKRRADQLSACGCDASGRPAGAGAGARLLKRLHGLRELLGIQQAQREVRRRGRVPGVLPPPRAYERPRGAPRAAPHPPSPHTARVRERGRGGRRARLVEHRGEALGGCGVLPLGERDEPAVQLDRALRRAASRALRQRLLGGLGRAKGEVQPHERKRERHRALRRRLRQQAPRGAVLPLLDVRAHQRERHCTLAQRQRRCAARARRRPCHPVPDLSRARARAPQPRARGTNWTRRVPHPVLIGHAASLTPY